MTIISRSVQTPLGPGIIYSIGVEPGFYLVAIHAGGFVKYRWFHARDLVLLRQTLRSVP